MKNRYEKYKKLNKEEIDILNEYIYDKLGNSLEGITMKDQREIYNTMEYGIYRLNISFKELGKNIKKNLPKQLFKINFYKISFIIYLILSIIDYLCNITY